MKSPRIASPRFVWAGLLSAMGVLCASARSEAACFLPRALALPAAMDANLRCDHDQDFNGLDDEMERLVAECLAPTLNFNSTHPSEIPNTTLFNVHLAPSEVRPGEIEVLVHYGLIWTRDEGHIAHNCQADAAACIYDCAYDVLGVPVLPDPLCEAECIVACDGACKAGNSHAGDTQSFSVHASIVAGADRWVVEAESITAGFPFVGAVAVREDTQNNRFSVFLSPGKHHFYSTQNAFDTYDVAGYVPNCADPHDGLGSVVSLDTVGMLHVPAYATPSLAAGCTAQSCDANSSFLNQCARELQNAGSFAATHFASPAEATAAVTCGYFEPGCGSIATGVSTMMNYPEVADRDGDGDTLKDAGDRCPLLKLSGSNHTDTPTRDFDNIPDACDPDPDGWNGYVGRTGTNALLPGAGRSALLGGYADFDHDNVADGVDICPSNAGVTATATSFTANMNRWAEDLDLSEVPGSLTWGAKTGWVRRGDVCDPYPVTRTQLWKSSLPGTNKLCNPATTMGSNDVTLQVDVLSGVSANDPTGGTSPRLVGFRARRCACVNEDAGCLDDPTSRCSRGRSRPANAPQPWQGWRVFYSDGCALGSDGECVAEPLSITAGQQVRREPTWNWLSEFAGRPDRFRPLSVSSVIGPLGQWRQADDPFVLAGMIDDNEVGPGDYLATPPGESLPHIPTASLYPEPDRDAVGVALKLTSVTTDQNRRLRASHAGPVNLTEQHDIIPLPTSCTTWAGGFKGLLLKPPYDPYKFPWVPNPDPNPWPIVFGKGIAGFDSDLLINPREGTSRKPVLEASAPDWLRSSDAVSIPTTYAQMRPPSGEDSIRVFPPPLSGGWSPALVRVERGPGSRGRYAFLQVAAQSPTEVTYATALEGTLPFALSATAEVVADPLSLFLAAVDPENGRILGYDPTLRRWFSNPLVGVPVGSTLAMSGAFVAATAPDGVRLVDALSGTSTRLEGMPVRTRPLLAFVRDTSTLVLVGGLDTAGVAHDDVWTIQPGRPGAVAKRLFGDTTGGRLVTPDAVLDPGDGVHVTALRSLGDGYGSMRATERTADGWEGPDDGSCAAGDALGGQLCTLAAGEFLRPGRRTCDTQTPSHACEGVAGTTTVTRRLPGADAVEAVADDGAVWVLRARSVERRALAANLSDTSVRSVAFQGKGAALLATAGGALLATSKGVSLATGGATFTLSGVTPTCGAPLSVAEVTPGRFVVATTAGATLLVRDGAALRATGHALAIPSRDADGWELTPLAAGATSAHACALADKVTPAGWLEGKVHVASVGGGHVLLARPPLVARLRIDGDTLDIQHVEVVLDPLKGLRFDSAVGGRAYGVGAVGHHVFDVRNGALGHTVGHDVASWVVRSDAGELSVRVDRGVVTIARVQR